jgi:hypothetical protein
VIGRLLLAVGYLSTPFAGPGSAVLTAAGWLAHGVEARRPTYSWVGLVGLLGVAGVLAGRYGYAGAGLEGLGGVVLLLYYVLSIAALWVAGIRSNNWALKAAAAALAIGWLLAAAGASTVGGAARAASGAVDWGGVSWANQAASSVIASIGGPEALAKLFTAAGAVLAALGFLGAAEAAAGQETAEEAVFRLGVY